MKTFQMFGLLAVFVLYAGASAAAACTCSPTAGTVLEEFAGSPNVVAVRLDEFEELDRSVEGGNVYRTMAAVMTVEKVYKGVIKINQRMRILDGAGGDCSMGFLRSQPGQKFLLYAGPPKRIGKLRGSLYLISSCSRSDRIEAAGSDLAFLDNRVAMAGKTRLSGTVKRFSADPPSLANIQVMVTGKDGYQQVAQTDENGFFELWGLPPGAYRVAFQVPKGTRLRDYKVVPSDRNWRRQAPPDNVVQVVVGPRKHVELTVGVESLR